MKNVRRFKVTDFVFFVPKGNVIKLRNLTNYAGLAPLRRHDEGNLPAAIRRLTGKEMASYLAMTSKVQPKKSLNLMTLPQETPLERDSWRPLSQRDSYGTLKPSGFTCS